MELVIYTDVSHSAEHKIASCGYLILQNGHEIKYEIVLLEGITKTTYGEAKAICLALEFTLENFENVKSIIVKTDCIGYTKRIGKKYRIHSNELNVIMDKFKEKGIKLEIKYVKGHSGNKKNTKVDYECRKYLRQYLRESGLVKTYVPLPGGKGMWI